MSGNERGWKPFLGLSMFGVRLMNPRQAGTLIRRCSVSDFIREVDGGELRVESEMLKGNPINASKYVHR
jgi:hypothetical protein